MVSIAPGRVFIGNATVTAVNTATHGFTDIKSTGAYIDIVNDTSRTYPLFEIGSTG
jgi:hypothetical protein